jgi:hypothetical protein
MSISVFKTSNLLNIKNIVEQTIKNCPTKCTKRRRGNTAFLALTQNMYYETLSSTRIYPEKGIKF